MTLRRPSTRRRTEQTIQPALSCNMCTSWSAQMSDLQFLVHRRSNLLIQVRLSLSCELLWFGRCSCGYVQVSTQARHEATQDV